MSLFPNKFPISFVLIIGVIFLLPPLKTTGTLSWYEGDVKIRRKITYDVEYDGESAIIDINGMYTLENKGEQKSVNYKIYRDSAEPIKKGELFFEKGEVKKVRVNLTKKIAHPPYVIRRELTIKINDKFPARIERKESIVRFPSEPTILFMADEPTSEKPEQFKWVNTEPGEYDINFGWIKKDVNVTVKEIITPETLNRGDQFTNKIIIKNHDQRTYECEVERRYPMQVYLPLREEKFTGVIPNDPTLSTWFFKKKFTLQPNEEVSFVHKMKFLGGNWEKDVSGIQKYSPGKLYISIPRFSYRKTIRTEISEIVKPDRKVRSSPYYWVKYVKNLIQVPHWLLELAL